MKHDTSALQPTGSPTAAPSDSEQIRDMYERLVDNFNRDVNTRLAAALVSRPSAAYLAGSELAAIMDSCAELSQIRSELTYHQAMHDFRGHISIINNAMGLYGLLSTEREREGLLNMISRNLQKLAGVAGQLSTMTDAKPVSKEIIKFLEKACQKLEKLLTLAP